jgi:hypothetical protein
LDGAAFKSCPSAPMTYRVSTAGISISVAWAISQYRQVLAAVAMAGRGVRQSMKVPTDSPEVIRYLRAIGIGRNVDAYA